MSVFCKCIVMFGIYGTLDKTACKELKTKEDVKTNIKTQLNFIMLSVSLAVEGL